LAIKALTVVSTKKSRSSHSHTH